MVAVNAKYSISVDKLLRNVTEQDHGLALFNNLNEQAAERKLVSILFFLLGMAARKSLTDKFSAYDNSNNIKERDKKMRTSLYENAIQHWNAINFLHGTRKKKHLAINLARINRNGNPM